MITLKGIPWAPFPLLVFILLCTWLLWHCLQRSYNMKLTVHSYVRQRGGCAHSGKWAALGCLAAVISTTPNVFCSNWRCAGGTSLSLDVSSLCWWPLKGQWQLTIDNSWTDRVVQLLGYGMACQLSVTLIKQLDTDSGQLFERNVYGWYWRRKALDAIDVFVITLLEAAIITRSFERFYGCRFVNNNNPNRILSITINYCVCALWVLIIPTAGELYDEYGNWVTWWKNWISCKWLR